MATERIDIVVTENGSRVVKRNLEDLDPAARKAAGGVDFLKRSLALLGGGLIARELLRMADTFTTLQNRLRVTGIEGSALTTVYKELLAVSNQTRSSVEGSVELYSRLAVSSKELGVSQRQLIDFTKSLNQAIILSGATSVEASNALVQLSQGMASGALRGDELRSVMEQLPAVADIIAKQLGVTRGELRKMGEEGKITANSILDAFKAARQELEEKFAKTVPTVGQSFQVLKNNVLDYVGRLDAATGFTVALSKTLLLLANNLDTVGAAVRGVAEAVLVAAAAYGVFQVALKADALLQAARNAVAFAQAVSSGRLVLLGSAEASRQQAAAAVVAAQADAAATTTALTMARANMAKAMAAAESVRATTAEGVATARASQLNAVAAADRVRWTQLQLVAERELELTRMRAQISDIGRMQSATRLAEIRKTEAALATTLAAAEGRVATAAAATAAAQTAQAAALKTASGQTLAARKALTAAEAAAAGSTAALATATAASSSAQAAAARQSGLLALALAAVGNAARAAWGAVTALFAVIAAHPIGFLLVALTAILGALTVFRDKVLLGLDSVTTFADLLRALGEVAGRAFDKLVEAAEGAFGPLIKLAREWFGAVDVSIAGILRAAAKGVDFFVGLWAGAVRATVAIFEGLPPALSDIFSQALNLILTRIARFVNDAGKLLNTVTEFVGLGKIASSLDFKLDNKDAGAAARLGTDIGAAFKEGFNSANGAAGAVESLLGRAQEFGQGRAEVDRLAKRFPSAVSTVAGPAAPVKVDDKGIDRATNALRSLLNTILPSSGALLELAKAQETLNTAQAKGLITGEQNARYMQLARRYYEDVINPLGAINRGLDEQAALLGVATDARETESNLLRITQDLQRQGRDLSTEETDALRVKLQALKDLTAATQAQDALFAASIGKRREFQVQLTALQAMQSNPQFTKGDTAQATVGLLQEVGLNVEGTQAAADAQVAVFEAMYARIGALRDAFLISESDAEQLRAQVAVEQNAIKLKSAEDFFGALSSLSTSENKKLAAIGKAAAIAEATIQGVVAVQRALASGSPPANYITAAAVGVAAAANVAKIAGIGFQGGGYTGDMGVTDVAGVVHGREFVVNAEGTKRNRAALEAMNSGQTLAMGGASGGGVVNNITIVNNADGTRVSQQENENGTGGRDIELLIESVAARSVTRGGMLGQAMSSTFNLNRAVSADR